MFLKIKKSFKILLLLITLIPINIFAYSSYIIPGGENIGISINTKGILIVGTYEINNQNPAIEAGLKTGDIIKKVNNVDVTNIDELVNQISKSENEASITYLRNDKEFETKLKLIK